MMTCTICAGEYYEGSGLYGDYPDPGQPCRCGIMAWGSPYDYAGWNGLIKYYRFKLGDWVIDLGGRILPESE